MAWKSLFRRKPEHKASKTAPLLVTLGNNAPRLTPRDFGQLADEGYRRNVIAYRCIRLIAENAATVPWRLLQKQGGGQPVQLETHPLLDLLKRPNPMQGGAELFGALFGHYLIAGNCYLESLGPENGSPIELWTLRPDRMRIVPGAGGVPTAYRYTVNGRAKDFAVDPVRGYSPVLHVKSFHPLDDWYGMSPLEAAALSVDQHNDAGKWNASLLQSAGRPSGALVYHPPYAESSGVLTDEQRMVLKEELERHFTGSANAGRPMVLEGGLDWREMSISPKDMDWVSGKDISAREIALAFHVPPQLVGINGSLTFANFEQARLALYDDAILPLLTHFKDELNNWLVPQFGKDLVLDIDLTKIEALSYRRDQMWDRVAGSDFLTLDEKRQMVGLPPLGESKDRITVQEDKQ